jgi:hypothetical protein
MKVDRNVEGNPKQRSVKDAENDLRELELKIWMQGAGNREE